MKNLAYKHLDRKLSKIEAPEMFARPTRGWLRAVREALGLTTSQLAKRLGISQPTVMNMEKAEQRGAISLETLERAASAMNCKLVYALVPNDSFEETIRNQAGKIAKKRLERVNHTMRLEDQAVSAKTVKAEHERLVDELMRGNLRRLWDEE
jgi:predicted DNA-binding mobile mystery protein A